MMNVDRSAAMAGNWKDVLKAQYEDLQRLEDLDKELNAESVTATVDKMLQRPISASYRASSASSSSSGHNGGTKVLSARHMEDDIEPQPQLQVRPHPTTSKLQHGLHNIDFASEFDDLPPSYDIGSANRPRPSPNKTGATIPLDLDDIGEHGGSLSRPQSARSTAGGAAQNGANSPELTRGVDSTGRLHRAKVKMMEKQLDDAAEIRKHLNDQITDLQKQLKAEREEGKKMKKRIQLLEADSRRNGRQQPTDAASGTAGADVEQLNQEIAQLKKDLQTVERIAKQADQTNKSKDTQLKRAMETITRLKEQVTEHQHVQQHAAPVDRSQFDALEQKVRTLEKQKMDLISAFRKQMKLIDILKRQKAHIEAARLLSFTEEEFMKTLDWAT